jgi:O-antigen/teichoic acid export membrane protein
VVRSDERSISRLVGLSTGARLLGLPISLAASLGSTYLILNSYDADAFATFGLLISLASILPFADLGLGAKIVNTVADESSSRQHKLNVIWKIQRLLFGTGAVGIGTALALQVSNSWPSALGTSLTSGETTSATISLALFSLTVPLGVGQRVLLAINKNHLTLLIQAGQPALMLLLIYMSSTFSLPAALLAPAFYLANLVTASVTYVAADKASSGLLFAAARAHVPTTEKIWSTAIPMVVVMVCLPLAIQGHRLVLSHALGPTAVAQYQLAGQFFNPVWAAVSVAGTTLWPHFASNRRLTVGGVLRPAAAVLLLAVVGATVAGTAAWTLGPILAQGLVRTDPQLILALAAMIIAQGAQIVLGIALTDPSGLRVQAVASVLLLSSVLPLGYVLAPVVGSWTVPAITALGIVVFQVVPNVIVIAHRSKTIESRR